MRVEVVGNRDAEVGWGWGFVAPRGGYWVYVLGIAWPSKMCGGGGRGSPWDGIDMRVEVVGGQDAEIGQAWGFLAPRGGY
jgi:hypothetical protein